MSKVILTIDESFYQKLVSEKQLDDIPRYVSVLPDASSLQENENYKKLSKEYKKAKDALNKFIFENTTNK